MRINRHFVWGSQTAHNPQRLKIKARRLARSKERRRHRDEVLRPKSAAKALTKALSNG